MSVSTAAPVRHAKLTADAVARHVDALTRRHGTRCPFALCRAMGIRLDSYPMGAGTGACKGFFLVVSRQKSITLNGDQPEGVLRVILAHELGHAALHPHAVAGQSRCGGLRPFHDFAQADARRALEHEANLFAAELLVEDAALSKTAFRDGETLAALASRLGVPPELLRYKARALRARGVPCAPLPPDTDAGFLKDV